jgi:hypothetical protein
MIVELQVRTACSLLRQYAHPSIRVHGRIVFEKKKIRETRKKEDPRELSSKKRRSERPSLLRQCAHPSLRVHGRIVFEKKKIRETRRGVEG